MKALFRNLFVLSSIIALASCGLLGKKADADAGAEAAVAETPADAAPAAPVATAAAAVNENDIARFPDETKLADVAATTKRFAFLRESPGNGKVVTSLNANVNVTEIAQRQTFFLVKTDVAGQTKMGWLSGDAFQPPPPDAGLKAPTCAAPEVPLMGDTPFCGKVCGGDVDCPAGQACKGTAQRFSANSLLPGTVAVCTVVNRPLGQSSFTIDAGAPTPPVAAVPDIVNPPCPAGFIQLKDKRCHKNCANAAGQKICQFFCLRCEGQQVCNLLNKCPN
jgi:hypothetical protein